ncbi:MAG: hypothetical protein COV52_08640 [Gammaproteobacteria bacterium CG11_big_fil_rev_8_21_14_0_20_46_22]|nr:MAG: hypothetical protein COW05_01110 [Gammaproteobacteria bacterium CG12_big_fil_rev_8_21_14_0_65_46_12]PIR10560.1 MAG: hypothetical protein COV52_08640 [Gammaproteobacteria bacterium CG11_big_fil_rev_8_21_14_0_20_46_22]
MKIIKALLPLGLLLLLSGSVFADMATPALPSGDHFGGMLSFFTVPHSDESLALLGMLFGGMGDVLPGAPSVMGAMFAKFNASILVLTTLVFLYTMLMGLVSTAHEGEFLGKKYNSVWTPLRVVMGIGLLVPLKSGYCVLQIVLMWCVIQGIGAADTVWNAAMDFIELHSVYDQQNFETRQSHQSGGSFGSTMGDSALYATGLFKSYVCMYQSYKYNNNNKAATSTLGLPKASIVQSVWDSGKEYHYMIYHFPSYKAGPDGTPVIAKNSGCGSFTVPIFAKSSLQLNASYYEEHAAVQSVADVMTLLNQAGKEYVASNVTSDTSPDDLAQAVPGTPITAAEEYIANHVSNASDQWIDQHKSQFNIANSNNSSQGTKDAQQSKAFLEGERRYGWIYAGAFYKQLALSSPEYAAVNVFGLFSISNPVPSQVQGYTEPTVAQIALLSETANAGNKDNGLFNLSKQPYDNQANMPPEGVRAFNLFNDMVYGVVSAFVGGLSNYDPSSGMIVFQTGKDPVLQLQIMGQEIIQKVQLTFNILFGIAVAFVIASALVACLGSFFGILLKIIGFFGMICAMFYSIGLSMSVYIPMVPFIIFFFGAIGWMVAVIETMLAAPLVAIGIVYPEGGHELLGRAAPAAMLVTNVFLRPTFMIFGLIAGMLMTYIGVLLLNSIYQFVVYSNSHVGLTGLTSGSGVYSGVTALQWALYMAIYVSIVMVIINKSYALIHKLPDNVLRWIGGQAGFGDYSGGAEEVGSKVNKFTDQAGQSTGSAMGGMSSGASSAGDSLSQDLK